MLSKLRAVNILWKYFDFQKQKKGIDPANQFLFLLYLPENSEPLMTIYGRYWVDKYWSVKSLSNISFSENQAVLIFLKMVQTMSDAYKESFIKPLRGCKR